MNEKTIETKIVTDPKIENGEADFVLETEEGEIGLNFEKKPNSAPERQAWGGEIEFILTCVGYAVGLGNVWRFPYLCYKNGGGAFLIPYLIMIAIIGLPLFFLEFAFGQFASLGPITIWNICPLFKGIGYSMVLLSWVLGIYYIIIVSHCVFFLGSSFTNKLPWSDCGNWWNTELCNVTATGNQTTPAQEFYNNYVLEQSSSILDFGVPSWKLTLCLLACWIMVCLALIKGVQSLGKIAYFTAIFPYFVLTILLIKSLFSKGCGNGIYYYIKPNWQHLKSVTVWIQAATQIFFSLSVGNGGLIAMSSFNRFKNNCYRDAFLIVLINCGTSVFAGFVIFANLGIMAEEKGVEVSEVAKAGAGLVFEVYPEALSKFPIAPLWSIIFFLMMFTLGMGSELSTVECVLTGMIDELTRIKIIKTKKHAILFRVLACSIGFLLGLPFLCNGGNYLINLVDTTLSGYPLLCIAFCEIVVVSYIYGIRQFKRDIALMIEKKPNIYWIGSWTVVTPVVTFGLIISCFISSDIADYPIAWQIFSHCLSFLIISCIPIFFLYKYCREGGFILLKEFMKPVHEWGPAHDNYRKEFIDEIARKKAKKAYEDNSKLNVGNPMLDDVDSAHSFFQSKLSVADKLATVHTKEILKRSGADMNSPEAIACLTASQGALAGQSQQRLAQMMAQAMSGAADVGNAQLNAEKKKVEEAAKNYEAAQNDVKSADENEEKIHKL